MGNSTRFARVLALALGGLALQAAQAAGSYYDLGYGITASGSSANGSVVGAYVTGDAYYMWTAATGVMPLGGQWQGGVASVSADGSRISGSLTAGDGLNYAGYYTVSTGNWTSLGGIGGASDNSSSSAWNISGDGSTVVGLGWVNAGSAHAVRSTPAGTLQDLGSLGGSSRANGVSYDGSVITGWVEQPNGGWTGAYWKNGVLHNMVDGDGNPLQEGNAVSADGTWIVGTAAFGPNWRYNTVTSQVEWLGDLDPFGDFQGATGISADGRIVVGYDRSFGPAVFGQGTIWIEGQGMLNLTTYVTEQGVDLGGRTLALPMGVSADGSTIYGMDDTGSGFVVTLTPVPEPASYATLGLGLALLATRRWRLHARRDASQVQ